MGQTRPLRIAAAALLPAILCGQPAAAPDEIRVSSRAYAAASPYSIRVETKLVELNVAVRDWKGRAIAGLKREDFRIYDEGKEREIAAFSEQSAGGSAPSPEGEAPAPSSAARARCSTAGTVSRPVYRRRQR
jgi:hypothetical protein